MASLVYSSTSNSEICNILPISLLASYFDGLLTKVTSNAPLQTSIDKALSRLKTDVKDNLESKHLRIGAEDRAQSKLVESSEPKKRKVIKRMVLLPSKKSPKRPTLNEDEAVDQEEIRRFAYLRGKDRQKMREEWERKVKECREFIKRMQSVQKLSKDGSSKRTLDSFDDQEALRNSQKMEEILREEQAIKEAERKSQFEGRLSERHRNHKLVIKPRAKYGDIKNIKAMAREEYRSLVLSPTNIEQEEIQSSQKRYHNIINKYGNSHYSMSVSSKNERESHEPNPQTSSRNSNTFRGLATEEAVAECDEDIEKCNGRGFAASAGDP
eukprot:TRINITY_DN7902_c0_g1_i15.p1 TRINITY_DN7902_c0_g1~~TRINITY_DN7902_c0_g1_i15.p1  ORF type:complete len:326 (-),score=87.16 TRINITY_DN7902_c0_g1_i15:93-1070(-)